MSTFSTTASIIAIGCGATLVMDVWLVMLRRLGVRTASFGMIGRWIAHIFRGRFVHASIAKSDPVRGEDALGWVVHYAIGIVFASLLVAMTGTGWIEAPTAAPAILFGVISVAAPLLVMQPAMGSGFLASKTPTPMANCVRSVVNHGVFGAGLYVAAIAVTQIA
ncbi:MAG: DUF2938 domain-containing protein [Panacagrimonas sp.]